MNYQLEWGSKKPGLLIYLVDLSGSMSWDNKYARVSSAIWSVLDQLTMMCLEGNEYRERLHLEVIGYNQYTYPLFSGGVNDLIKFLDETIDPDSTPLNPHGKFIGKQKDCQPRGLTHMAMAYDKAAESVRSWISKQNALGRKIPAPVVINITDGRPEEKGLNFAESRAKALKSAKELMGISVPDGNVLLFNIHIDGKPGGVAELVTPAVRPSDDDRAFLFDASSEMPDVFIQRAAIMQPPIPAKKGSHFMVSNVSDDRTLARLIAFGSAPSGADISERLETPI